MIWHVWRAHRIAILTQAHIKVSQRPLHPHLCAPLTYLSFLHDQHTTVKYAAHIHTVNQICCTHVQPDIHAHAHAHAIRYTAHIHRQSDILHTCAARHTCTCTCNQLYCTYIHSQMHCMHTCSQTYCTYIQLLHMHAMTNCYATHHDCRTTALATGTNTNSPCGSPVITFA